jgi:hypothetical protein
MYLAFLFNLIKELLENESISSGIFNVADTDTMATNKLIALLSIAQNKQPKTLAVPKNTIIALARIGDFLHLPLNSERLQKLTESYVVNANKIVNAIGKPLPVSAEDGLIKTFQSFHNAQ